MPTTLIQETDGRGHSTVALEIPDAAGTTIIQVTGTGVSPLTFTYTIEAAPAGPPAALVSTIAGETQVIGSSGTIKIPITVTDENGVGVPDVPVTFRIKPGGVGELS